jgi:hypothetical protein
MDSHGGMIFTGGKLMICLPDISSNPNSSHLLAKQEELTKEVMYFVDEIFLYTCVVFLLDVKFYGMGRTALRRSE